MFLLKRSGTCTVSQPRRWDYPSYQLQPAHRSTSITTKSYSSSRSIARTSCGWGLLPIADQRAIFPDDGDASNPVVIKSDEKAHSRRPIELGHWSRDVAAQYFTILFLLLAYAAVPAGTEVYDRSRAKRKTEL